MLSSIVSPLDGFRSPFGPPRGFNPARLFSGTDTGWLYDLYDMSTLFQDAAGTTPVTAFGQPVGRCLDKSGRGNHRSQSASLPRPTYARHPLGGIRNLMTFTEQFDNAGWGNQISGTGVAPIRTPNAALAPNGEMTADLITINRGAGNTISDISGIGQVFSTSAGTCTGGVWVKAATAGDVGKQIAIRHRSTAYFIVTLTADWVRVSFSQTGSAVSFDIVSRGTVTVDNAVSLHIWGASLQEGAVEGAYQRVVSVFDVTEAGVPDLYYLSYDGLNDSLSTAPFAWGSDKATICAGVRKLSDAAVGQIIGVPTGSGRVVLEHPASAGYQFFSVGTLSSQANVTTGFPAPISNVLTGIGDISGDLAALRVNGIQVAQSTADQGTGNYGTHAIFFGARAGTSLFFNGREYSQFAINRLLTANELSQIERYTAQRTGVTI